MANLRIEDLRVDLDSALTALYTEEERADEAEKRAAELQEQLDMANKEIAELKYTLKLADQQIKELRPW
jgi:chromosome segregation ATPase